MVDFLLVYVIRNKLPSLVDADEIRTDEYVLKSVLSGNFNVDMMPLRGNGGVSLLICR